MSKFLQKQSEPTPISKSHDLLIPIRVQCPLDDRSGVNLLRVNRDDSEWVWESEDITLNEGICRDDCCVVKGWSKRMSHRMGK